MSIQAAQRLGLSCLSLDPGTDTPASQVAAAIQGNLDDPERVAEIFHSCSRVTLENEFIPAEAIQRAINLAGVDLGVLMPGVGCLATIQDKLLQRQALMRAGVPSPKAVEVPAENALAAVEGWTFPIVLKARFGGYDGKGTRYARTPEDFETFRPLWSGGGWLAEEFVPFRRELAAMVYRSSAGMGCFPTMETIQTNHVCDLVFPCDADGSQVAMAAIEAVGGYGLFGVELFQLPTGEILVNEIAPRPHNTGHYTLDWGGVSQFEQHVRLAMGFPTDPPVGGPVCMANLLGIENAGDHQRGIAAALREPGVHVHWYGKVEARPGRKMGHLNAVGEDCVESAQSARARFMEGWKA